MSGQQIGYSEQTSSKIPPTKRNHSLANEIEMHSRHSIGHEFEKNRHVQIKIFIFLILKLDVYKNPIVVLKSNYC